MPATPRWLLVVPDAIRQLEALDRDLLTRRDVERLFGVSRARAAQLMRTFGAERVGAAADGPGALAASRPGDDQAAGGGGSPALDLLPHVPGDGDHGVSVEWGDARTRARLPEDDEALRPDGGHDHRRRDRAHRDLGGGRTARRRAPRDGRSARRDGRAARGRVRHGGVHVATTVQRLTYITATHTRQLDAAALAAYLSEIHDAGRAASSAAMAVGAEARRPVPWRSVRRPGGGWPASLPDRPVGSRRTSLKTGLERTRLPSFRGLHPDCE